MTCWRHHVNVVGAPGAETVRSMPARDLFRILDSFDSELQERRPRIELTCALTEASTVSPSMSEVAWERLEGLVDQLAASVTWQSASLK